MVVCLRCFDSENRRKLGMKVWESSESEGQGNREFDGERERERERERFRETLFRLA